jgi:hypothetical protein
MNRDVRYGGLFVRRFTTSMLELVTIKGYHPIPNQQINICEDIPATLSHLKL